jgi:hypothetical protein
MNTRHLNSAEIQLGNMSAGRELVVTLMRMVDFFIFRGTVIEQVEFSLLNVELCCVYVYNWQILVSRTSKGRLKVPLYTDDLSAYLARYSYLLCFEGLFYHAVSS